MSAGQAPPSANLYFAELPVGFTEADVQRVLGAYGTMTQTKILWATPGSKVAALVRYATVDEATWIVQNLNGNIPQGLTEPVVVRYAETPESKAQKAAAYGPAQGAYGKGQAPAARVQPYTPAAYSPKGAKGAKGASMSYQTAGKGAWEEAWAAPAKGKGKGKGSISIKMLYKGLCESEVFPGGSKYSNDENTLFVAGLPSDTQDVDLYKMFSPFGAIAPRGVRAMLHPDGNCKGFGFVNFMDSTTSQSAITALNGAQIMDGSTLVVKQKAASTKAEAEGSA